MNNILLISSPRDMERGLQPNKWASEDSKEDTVAVLGLDMMGWVGT